MSKKKKEKLPNNTFPIKSHFLDSGSFTLRTQATRWGEENDRDMWEYYDQPEFYEYMDNYAAFIKKFSVAIDHYANVDAIPNPEITWRNQQYMENEHGLHPVPVVHFDGSTKTLKKWLTHYIDLGYDFIALGSLVGNTNKDDCLRWLDTAFDIVCDTPDRCPQVKIHGFGIGRYKLLVKYPWWSTDSTTWTKVGAYGGVFFPPFRKGKWRFDLKPRIVKVSVESPDRYKIQGPHYTALSKMEKDLFHRWLKEIDIPLGSLDEKDEKIEEGVLSWHVPRRIANLYYYERMLKTLPKWPWPYISKDKSGFFGMVKKRKKK